MSKVILITGASRGIGKEIALTLARKGARVVVNYSSSKKEADLVVAQIKEEGGQAIAVRADVSNRKEVIRLFDKTIEHFGKIDVLINNAGIMKNKLLKEATDKDFSSQFEVNVKGIFHTLQEADAKLSDNGNIITGDECRI